MKYKFVLTFSKKLARFFLDEILTASRRQIVDWPLHFYCTNFFLKKVQNFQRTDMFHLRIDVCDDPQIFCNHCASENDAVVQQSGTLPWRCAPITIGLGNKK